MTTLSAPVAPVALSREAVREIATFGAIGIISTAAYVGLYAALRTIWVAALANAAALLITAVGNTAANRRFTFKVQGRSGLARDHLAGLIALGAALAITSASLAALSLLAPHQPRITEIAVLVTANAAATLMRFLILRLAIGRPAHPAPPTAQSAPRAAPSQPASPATHASLTITERTRG